MGSFVFRKSFHFSHIFFFFTVLSCHCYTYCLMFGSKVAKTISHYWFSHLLLQYWANIEDHIIHEWNGDLNEGFPEVQAILKWWPGTLFVPWWEKSRHYNRHQTSNKMQLMPAKKRTHRMQLKSTAKLEKLWKPTFYSKYNQVFGVLLILYK